MLKELVGGNFFKLGFDNEIDYWKSLGGTGEGTEDVMVSYLASQGYSGTPEDMLNAWLVAQNSGSRGTIGDNARAFVGS